MFELQHNAGVARLPAAWNNLHSQTSAYRARVPSDDPVHAYRDPSDDHARIGRVGLPNIH
jgi:hypothetical protein